MSEGIASASRGAGPRRPFLTGEWRQLCFINYAVAPDRLQSYLPPGLTIDAVDGEGFVSVVALRFLDLGVLGIPVPGYRSFPQINLRFYVREGTRRGVVFLREHVPSRLMSWAARGIVNEPYAHASMRSAVRQHGENLEIEHRLVAGGRTQRLLVTARNAPRVPDEKSSDHFFKERHWGYNLSRRGRLVRYEVHHPAWETYPVERCDLDWDFGAVYGREWADLGSVEPRSVVLARGSAVKMFLDA